ncbi:MAG: DUF1579 domain-containing protein [Planctomycetales bacterium]
MNGRKLFAFACVGAAVAAMLLGTMAIADPPQEPKITGQPEFKLPPGWTEADFQACLLAGTPGKEHEHLAQGVGVWDCKTTMWMAPGTEPMQSGGTMTVTSVMDGRYTKCEIKGEIPGMGPYLASGVYGFDNVSRKFVATFIDNHSTGIMTGTGELSKDGKTLTWKYTYNCPITKKPTVMREIETITGPDTRTLVAFGIDPKSGKEFQMMSVEMTRKKTGS